MTPASQAPSSAALPPARPRKRGRPPVKKPPQTAEQSRLGALVGEAEGRRDAAAAAYKGSKTVASELSLLQSELEVATGWSAYLRSTGDHTAAIKYSDSAAKFSGRVAQLRELVATDLLAELASKARRELDVGRRIGGAR